MTEQQRLFLVQARSDYEVFKFFQQHPHYSACHALYHLQMATELLGKAHLWKSGPAAMSHSAFDSFVATLATNRQAQGRLGYDGKNAAWKMLIRSCRPLANEIEKLAPALAQDGPNPEYPWPRNSPIYAPAEHPFEVWDKLRKTASGRQFLEFLDRLFAIAEGFL